MAHAKDKHYWSQLRAVLTAGDWDAPFPAKAPNGSPLSWSELLRKFNKHCSGYKDVSELASQTQALSLFISANAQDQTLDGNEPSQHGPLVLDGECVLPQERVEEATAGYDTLKNMQSSNSDSITFVVAYYAYALGRPSECLSLLAQVRDISNAHIPASGSVRSQISTLQVPSGVAASSSTSLAWTGSLASSSASIVSVADISDGRSWSAIESIRSICLQGMSHEKLSANDPQTALTAYMAASPLLNTIESEIECSIIGPPLSHRSSFTHYRELWRWVERLLRRGIVLAARVCDIGVPNSALWILFAHYYKCSAHWPPTFRPEYRSAISVLYLRALVLHARGVPEQNRLARWVSTARSVLQEYCAMLSVSTRFPRAGERNTKVEDLVDLSVAVWEADGAVGEFAGWVIDIIWWATRLTFNSYRVFRHMARLLYSSGDTDLAKRTLRLYVQIVSKAREASMAASADMPNSGSIVDVDTDRNWVQMLVYGARMLCRLALYEADFAKGLEQAKEAGVLIEKAKSRLDKEDKELLASLQLAEGIWHSVMAVREEDPNGRIARLSESLAMLNMSVGIFPTPSGYHHLALAFARPGPLQDMAKAIEVVKLAIESDQDEIRHWHLLGLLLAATGDWRAAKEVLELGVANGQDDLMTEEVAPPVTNADGMSPVHARDFATPSVVPNENGANNNENEGPDHLTSSVILGTLLYSGDDDVPCSASLLQPLPDRPTPSRQELFEQALQLRMTQLSLTEFADGPEGVSAKWLEVFQWFADRRKVTVEEGRQSIDGRKSSADIQSSEATQRPQFEKAAVHRMSLSYTPTNRTDTDHLPTPIPITITPATPDGNHADAEKSYVSSIPSINEDSPAGKRSTSLSLDEKDRDITRGGKVRAVLKNGVHKGQARITTISKKIGHVGRHTSVNLSRSTSAPDFHAVLSQTSNQASSIHLRQYHNVQASLNNVPLLDQPPSPLPSLPTQIPLQQDARTARDRRLLSNLWLMSAATFRRLGKIEQARAAIQEAEIRDEANPAVWVQLGLYHIALNHERQAIQAFQKALFFSPDDISATVHLCRLYLSQSSLSSSTHPAEPDRTDVDLAAGLLSDLTRGVGWSVSEAWYYLAKAYSLQGRKDRERECLSFALGLSETRGVRDIGSAVGWCL